MAIAFAWAAQRGVVTLDGDVPSAPQKEMAEFDAWYVLCVGKVANWLEVRS
jgi:osmotically-inducible protein OsmY